MPPYAGPVALAAMLAVLASGCAGPPPVSAPTTPATSAAPAASSRPPRSATDNYKPTPWIVGTVTAGGTGPCYGLITDEGVRYALHSTAGTRLDQGARIRIKGRPSQLRIDCGEGALLELTAVSPVR